MNQGKYKRKIYVTFLLVFSVLIVIATGGVFFTTVLERSTIEREAAIAQSLKTAVSNSSLNMKYLIMPWNPLPLATR